MKRSGFFSGRNSVILQLIFPRVCPVCGEILTKKNRYPKNPYICGACYEKLDFLDGGSRCMKCSKPLSDPDAQYCPECIKKHRCFDAGASLLSHDDYARRIIYGLKFHGLKENAYFPALDLARRYMNVIRLWDIDAVIPVPLHKKKRIQRGYNQAELFALAFSGFLAELEKTRIPVDTKLLVRSKKTKPQMGLAPGERSRNITGAFTAVSPCKYKNVLLADDIFTTGATLSECARVLKEAGAEHVYFISISVVC